MMISKVQQSHKEKAAYIYIRQSTMNQVRHNQESTERQYALREKALNLGWTPTLIKMLDNDLGLSGASSEARSDFKTLVADVSMQKVGAVFALEASRLARSCTDWHRLIELCSLTNTLILDEDGCYDPADFNDQLLLGLKGTMSQAELHFIRARLLGGKLNKAKKGELRFPLPVGFCYDDDDKRVLDPDDQVRSSIALLFETFRRTGSAYAVVHEFSRLNLQFPKRAYGGIWKGKLIWGRLTHSRVLGILKNPSYAGAYVFGRYHYLKNITPEGKILSTPAIRPMDEWTVNIENHHEAYISWEEYLHNQKALKANRTNGEGTVLSGPAREGLALLQGLLICGTCGRRLHPRYKGNGGIYPTYQCNWKRREGLSTTSCMSLACSLLDNAISSRVLQLIQPDHLKIALAALNELEKRDEAVTKQWRMKIERAEYDAQLAQKRYEEVDPSNRLVAATLERRWNDALQNLEELKASTVEHEHKHSLALTAEQKTQILALAKDLPKIWKADTTNAQDRKRIIRLLVRDITVEKNKGQKQAILHIRWHSGATEDIPVTLPPPVMDRLRYPRKIIDKVRRLAQSLTDKDICVALNREGILSSTGKPFTEAMIKWIRYKHKIPALNSRQPHELTVGQVAEKLRVSRSVVYYWIERNHLQARCDRKTGPYWITLDQDTEVKLRYWVQNSWRIQGKNFPKTSRKKIEGGAL
jgi:DNA invertase Pin-like site-specific DNA recombinase